MAPRDPFFSARAEAPYFATIFSWTSGVPHEVFETFIAEIYEEIAAAPGFIGIERISGGDNSGIAVSYWETRPTLMAWLERVRRSVTARDAWHADQVFRDFSLRIVKVEQAIDMADTGPDTRFL